ncbi:MAG TPA: hypothetical protein VED87_04000 [Methylocystis sp.]|nr:hypothetical protein [Methylocystis sp.]
MSHRPLQALNTLDQASWETMQFTKQLFHESWDEPSSEALVATFFGLLGVLAAYAYSASEPAGTFPVAAPVGGALGIMLGVLFRRGPRRLALERRVKDREIENAAKGRKAELILKHLGELPDDAPYEVREDMWRAYRNILQDLAQETK